MADTRLHTVLFYLHKALKSGQSNQCWEGVSVVVFFGVVCKWKKAWFIGAFWSVDNILFLDLCDLYSCVLTWPKLIVLHTYDLCNVLSIMYHKIKLKKKWTQCMCQVEVKKKKIKVKQNEKENSRGIDYERNWFNFFQF